MHEIGKGMNEYRENRMDEIMNRASLPYGKSCLILTTHSFLQPMVVDIIINKPDFSTIRLTNHGMIYIIDDHGYRNLNR